jgi:hypothetical protein
LSADDLCHRRCGAGEHDGSPLGVNLDNVQSRMAHKFPDSVNVARIRRGDVADVACQIAVDLVDLVNIISVRI